jgi:hypothetical protein
LLTAKWFPGPIQVHCGESPQPARESRALPEAEGPVPTFNITLEEDWHPQATATP